MSEEQTFSGGIAYGYHGCPEQADDLFLTIVNALSARESVIIRGPFRVGKTKLGLGAVELFVALLMDNFPNFDWAESKKMKQAFMAETIMRRRPNRERMARA